MQWNFKCISNFKKNLLKNIILYYRKILNKYFHYIILLREENKLKFAKNCLFIVRLKMIKNKINSKRYILIKQNLIE